MKKGGLGLGFGQGLAMCNTEHLRRAFNLRVSFIESARGFEVHIILPGHQRRVFRGDFAPLCHEVDHLESRDRSPNEGGPESIQESGQQ